MTKSTAPTIIDTTAQLVVSEVQTFTGEYSEEIDALDVSDQEGLELANEVLREVKRRTKVLEEKESEIVDPMNKALKAVRSLFGPPKKVLAQFEKTIKVKIAAAMEENYDKGRAALKAAAAASISGDEATAEKLMAEARELELQPVQGLSFRHTWDVEVVDYVKIPREYLAFDKAAALEAIREADGKVEIPGLRVVRKTSVASRA